MEPGLPTGTVTFLFTDIEGSTRLRQAQPEAYRQSLALHNALLTDVIQRCAGHVFKIIGDAFCAAFHTAPDGVRAALAAQWALQTAEWGAAPLPVRMALHTGAAELRDGDYWGFTLARAARLLPAAHGRQVLLSQATADLARDDLPAGAALHDLGEHRLRDLIRPEHIYQLTTPDLPDRFPPPKTLDAFPNNLPIQLSSFIGREKELAAIKHLLGEVRLLTLTGVGGTGKTRLSLQAAAEAAEHFRHGAWFVDLAPLADPALVPAAVAASLGLRDVPGQPPLETLTRYLADKTLLLVLDNCEHLLNACAQLADSLLRGAPHLRILATSREVLAVAGEQAYLVPSLALPELRPGAALEHLAEYEAIRLFVERAAAAQPAFALTDRNAQTVSQICQRLDGIPLAIELAAVRVRVFAVEQLATRLDDRFRLLTGGSRIGLERHQTLRATVDWSYQLLTGPERALLQRLSVFTGGWALEAAEDLAGSGSPQSADIPDVLDTLSQLVNKSLVLLDADAGRYRQMETIRQYAREKLIDAGEASHWRDHHLDYFVRLAAQEAPKLTGPEQIAAIDTLNAELDNFRAAFEWAAAAGQAEPALRLVSELWTFCIMTGHWREGYAWLKLALATTGPVAPSTRIRALVHGGFLAMWADTPAGKDLLQEALPQCRELGDTNLLAISLSGLGLFARDKQHDYAAAQAFFEQSLALHQALKHLWGMAMDFDNLRGVAMAQSDFTAARALGQESARLLRSIGDEWDLARLVHSQAELARFQKDYAGAEVLYAEAAAIESRSRMTSYQRAWQRAGLAYVRLRQGNTSAAASLFHESLTLLLDNRSSDAEYDLTESLAGMAGVALAKGQPQLAARLLGAVDARLATGDVPADPQDFAEYEQDLAATRLALSEPEFNQAWADGQALSPEQAAMIALEIEPNP